MSHVIAKFGHKIIKRVRRDQANALKSLRAQRNRLWHGRDAVGARRWQAQQRLVMDTQLPRLIDFAK
ncbi:MAG: hypothetical protein ABI767_03395 [Rhodanobacter sp.]